MSLFLKAAWGEFTERAPLWMMRQAGRYLPEYMALKERYTFWEMCRTPEVAAEVTLQPLRRFELDAAILFSDIMTPLAPMGFQIDFNPGPVFSNPARTAADVEQVRVPEAEEIAPFVMETLRILRGELKEETALIGFGGAPLTLATYAVEGKGSKDYALFRQFLRREPSLAHALLEKLTEVTIRYLRAQVEAGAQAIQLFDSWAGLHDEVIYRRFGLPYALRVFDALTDLDVPRIYIAVGASHLSGAINELPCEVMSLDWRMPIAAAREAFGTRCLQGNLDPAVLLGTTSEIEVEALRILREGLDGAHIFNLGHGMMKEAPVEHVAHLVNVVRGFDRARALEMRPSVRGGGASGLQRGRWI